MKLFEKIKCFINGFRKIKYEVPLAEEFSEMKLKFGNKSLHTIASIERRSNYYPIHNVRFGIKDFTCERLDPSYSTYLESINHPIYLMKSIGKEYNYVNLMENVVENTVISMGLDKNPWKITVKSYYVCNCFTHNFDDEFTDFCNQLSDAFLSDININAMMLNDDFNIDLFSDYNKSRGEISKRHFSGYVKSYGDLDLIEDIKVEDILDPTSYESPDESIVEESINQAVDFNKFIENDSLIFDVIRKYPIDSSFYRFNTSKI